MERLFVAVLIACLIGGGVLGAYTIALALIALLGVEKALNVGLVLSGLFVWGHVSWFLAGRALE